MRQQDRGFTLVEALVGMMLFGVFAAFTGVGVVQAQRQVSHVLDRMAATDLAAEQVETLRSLSTDAISAGTRTVTSRGTTYTVTTSVAYTAADTVSSLCEGTGGTLGRKLVTVAVSWPENGRTRTVRNDTLKLVSDTDTVGSTGTLAVLVAGIGADSGVAGVPVTVLAGASTATATTGATGCAVFTGLTAGVYSATASLAGVVGLVATTASGVASVDGLTVAAGTVARGRIYVDTARTLAVAFDGPPGAVVPVGMPLVTTGSYLNNLTLPTCIVGQLVPCTSGVPGTVSNLFPDVYTVRAGTCRPTAISEATADLRTTSGSVTVPVSAVTVNVRTATAGVTGRTVTLSRAATTGCSTGESYTTVSAAAGSVVLLPYGSWTARATTTATGTTYVSTAFSTDGSTNKTRSITLTVTS